MCLLGAFLFGAQLLVKEGSDSLVSAVLVKTVRLAGNRPVRVLVFDEFSILQPGEGRAYCTVVEIGLGRDLLGLERSIVVGVRKASTRSGTESSRRSSSVEFSNVSRSIDIPEILVRA